MEPTHMQFMSAATVLSVLGLAFALSAPVSGQEALQGGPMILKSGGPLLPTVTVERHGRLLVLTYGPKSADGGLLPNTRLRGKAPQFTVYKGQRRIASGQFEYG